MNQKSVRASHLKVAAHFLFLLPSMAVVLMIIVGTYIGAFLMYKTMIKPEPLAIEDATEVCQEVSLAYNENAELISGITWLLIIISIAV